MFFEVLLFGHHTLNLSYHNSATPEQIDIIIKSLTNEEVLSLCGWDYIREALLSATS
jgi:hypothetical protein